MKKIKIKIKISNLNKYTIFIVSFIFFYLFYLSIPTLYNKDRLQNFLNSELLNEFKLDLSLSASMNYLILPTPHFEVKDVKLFNRSADSVKEIGQIKKLKIFISQKNLFSQKNLKINEILLDDTNFLIEKSDLKFLNNYYKKKFSHKKIKIKNSTIFYQDINNENILILTLNKINLYFDKKKLTNKINGKGNIFNIPFMIESKRQFAKGRLSKFFIKFKKLNLNIENITSDNNKNNSGKNVILFNQSNISTNYELKKNLVYLKSQNSKIQNKKLNYSGEIYTNPFYININLNLDKFNIKNLFNDDLILELLKTNLLFNKNFNGNVLFTSDNLLKNKLFKTSKINLNLKNGKIYINNSELINKKLGNLFLKNSMISLVNNHLVFKGDFNYAINNQKNFYRTFQIPKKNKNNLKSIDFKFEKNFHNNRIKITAVKLNNIPMILSESLKEIINNDDTEGKFGFDNWISFKKFINLILEN